MAKTASAKATKATTKVSKTTKASKKAEPVKQKVEDSSSSSSSESDSSSSDSESEEETKKVTKKVTKKAAKKEESSDSSSSESESEKEEAKAASSSSDSESEDEEEEEAKKEDSSSDSDSDDKSDSDSEEEAKKSDSDDSSSSSSESESEDEKMEEATANGKRKAETEVESPAKVAKVESDEVHTIWIGGLDYNATNEDVKQLFAECGTVLDARIVSDKMTGRSKGYGYVDFADAESKEKAKEYHETEYMGRQLRIDDAPTRGAQPHDNGAQRSKPLSAKSDTVFCGNLSFDMDDTTLRQSFEEYGNVIGVRLPTDRETGNLKGYGYVQFDSEDSAEAAINALNGAEILGRAVRLDFGGARPQNSGGDRGGFGGGRGGRGGFGGGRGGRGGFGDRGGRGGRGGFGDRGGRGGARGGRGGGFNRPSGPSGTHVKF